ncbi:hypothetical protein IW150_001900 [Coemansia sp. RSA 2607]|nr:hypothetical protein IW150_001900 [Coemansia sp. RSA 2607]
MTQGRRASPGDTRSYTTRDKLAVLSLVSALDTQDWATIAAALEKRVLGELQSVRLYSYDDCQRIYQLALSDAQRAQNVRPAMTTDHTAILREAIGYARCRRLDEIQSRLRDIDSQIAGTGVESNVDIDAAKHGHTSDGVPGSDTVCDTDGKVAINDTTEKTHSSSKPNDSEYEAKAEDTNLHSADTGINASTGSDADTSSKDKEMLQMPSEDDGNTSTETKDAHDSSVVAVEQELLQSDNAENQQGSSILTSPGKPEESNEPNESGEPGEPDRRVLTEEVSETVNVDTAVEEANDDKLSGETTQIGDHISKDSLPEQSPPVSASSRTGMLTAEEQQLKNWKKNITTVWREISGHRYGSMFVGPIKSSDAPNYYDVIRKPIDLKMIKNRIRDEEITTTVEFYRDIMHMLMNALMYNAEDTDVYQMAMEMIPGAQACVEQLLQTEAAVNVPKGSEVAGDGMGDGTRSPVSALTSTQTTKGEDGERSTEIAHHEAEDSDSSLPAKRKRRIASERASKNLRA